MKKYLLFWEFVMTVVILSLFAALFSIQHGWGLQGRDRHLCALFSLLISGFVALMITIVGATAAMHDRKEMNRFSASIVVSGIAAGNATIITAIVILVAVTINTVIVFISSFSVSLVTFIFIFIAAMLVAGVNSEEENKSSNVFSVVVFALAEILFIFAGLFIMIFAI